MELILKMEQFQMCANYLDSLTQAAQQVSDQLYGMGGSIQPSFTCSSCFCTPHTVSVLIRPSPLP